MDKSQRRISITAVRASGKRWILLPVWLLAVLVAYLVIFELPSGQSSGATGTLSSPACAMGADCILEQPSGAVAELPATLPDQAGNVDPDSYRVAAPRGQEAAAERLAAEASPAAGLQPHMTSAEVCGTAEDGSYRCRSFAGPLDGSSVDSWANASTDKTYIIAGQVLTTAGRGLEGVAIVALPGALSHGADPSGLRFRTVTDSVGAYTLEGLPDGEYTIRSSAQGEYGPGRISVRAGVRYADLIVAKRSVQVLEGQVIAATGEPLEGVAVMPLLLGQPSALSDDDGRFRLEVALKPGVTTLNVAFERPGYRRLTRRVLFRRDDLGTVTLMPVEIWTSVTGSVLDDNGEPVSGRQVELRMRSQRDRQTVATDGDGRFEFPVVEAPADYQLTVFGGEAHEDYRQKLRVSEATAPVDVTLNKYEFGEITGQLVNLYGTPVADFNLVIRNLRSQQPNVTLSTDTRGGFEIAAVPAGELVIAAQSSPAVLVQGLELEPGGQLDVPLVIDWGQHELRGTVLDGAGMPVPAARIVLQWSHAAGDITTRSTRRTAADSHGHFVLSELGPGPHVLRVDAPGFRTATVEHDLDRQGYELTVRLNRAFGTGKLARLD